MDLQKYIDIPNVGIPHKIEVKLDSPGEITPTKFEDKNDVLRDGELHMECGYTLMDGDYYLVSMYTPLPNVTKEMIEWWFWWHPQDTMNYKTGYPGEHMGISYASKDKEYFSAKTVPPFAPNTNYPIERMSKVFAAIAIDFVSPIDFGFDADLVGNAETIVCGHVSAVKGLIANTDMAHLFFKHNNGLFLVSRFWVGKNVKLKLLKRFFVTDALARGLAEHCCIEYRNLANKLPSMYEEWLAETSQE